MASFLIVYASSHGHTGKIAARIGYDFTDWTAVHGFARRCGALAAAHTPR